MIEIDYVDHDTMVASIRALPDDVCNEQCKQELLNESTQAGSSEQDSPPEVDESST